MIKKITPIVFSLLLFTACDPGRYSSIPENVEGYSPVYSTDVAALKTIKAGPPRTTVNGGKMYTVGNLLFQVELDSGIHIINYATPASPQKLGFIKSFLCKELTVKNGFIYTNNLSDLVVIDINNPADVKEAGRTPNVFPDLASQYPPNNPVNQFERVYFDCPDPDKGTVVAWKKQTINNPKCWR